MTEEDIERLLQPISEASPCGENLEYDPVFLELEQVAKAPDDRMFGSEEAKVDASKNGKEVRRCCSDLFKRTKDLRVGVHFAHIETSIDGVQGLSSSIALLRGYVERYWETVHPRIEPDDEYGPTTRANTLATFSDPDGLLRLLRNTVLVKSKAVGTFTFRDLDIAEKRLPPPKDGLAPSIEQLASSLKEAGENYGQGQLAGLQSTVAHLKAIVAVFKAKTPQAVPDFLQFNKMLGYGIAFFEGRLTANENTAPTGVDVHSANENDQPDKQKSTGQTVQGELFTRGDAKRVLEQVCVFLQRTEPSNPAPILIRRAQNLLDLNFLDIIKNLAPESLAEMEKLAGPPET